MCQAWEDWKLHLSKTGAVLEEAMQKESPSVYSIYLLDSSHHLPEKDNISAVWLNAFGDKTGHDDVY